MNREEWLNLKTRDIVINILEPLGYDINGETGKPLWEDLKVSIGYPPKDALKNRGRVIGVCLSHKVSQGQFTEIFISPYVADSVEVLGVLIHELGHAVVGVDKGHGPEFSEYCDKIGMVGNVLSNVPGDVLESQLRTLVNSGVPYPHSSIDLTLQNRPAKAATRLLKIVCDNRKCDYHLSTGKVYTMRSTWSVIRDGGCPMCGSCNERMTVILEKGQVTGGSDGQGTPDPDAPPVLADGFGNGKPEPLPKNVKVKGSDPNKGNRKQKPTDEPQTSEPTDDESGEEFDPFEDEEFDPQDMQGDEGSSGHGSSGGKSKHTNTNLAPHPIDADCPCERCTDARQRLERPI